MFIEAKVPLLSVNPQASINLVCTRQQPYPRAAQLEWGNKIKVMKNNTGQVPQFVTDCCIKSTDFL